MVIKCLLNFIRIRRMTLMNNREQIEQSVISASAY
ncbi:TPA: DUF1024 family protein, partial [Staphylococcus aureus]|nr:DUF1024 family protein [Staphylococcus aureus]